MGESPHIVFGFDLGGETALAGERKIMPVSKIDVTFPGPTISIGISAQRPDEGLIAMRIGNFVSLPIFSIRFHRYDPSLSWTQ